MSTNAYDALVDTKLERMLVRTLIVFPDEHAACGDLGFGDFGDLKAGSVWNAIANLRAECVYVDVESVRAELQAAYLRRLELSGEPVPDWMRAGDQAEWTRQRLLAWYEAEILTVAVPDLPRVPDWAQQVSLLAETRRAAVAAAEPPRRRTPAGPRAENVEPTRLAEAFRRYTFERDGESTLVRWARAWWRYTGTRYVEHDDELLDRDVIAFLDVVVAPQQVTDRKTGATRTEMRRVTSRNKTLAEVRKALTFAMPTIAGGAPQWTSHEDGDPPAEHLAVCANGILDLRDLTLRPPTPRLFATTAIGAPWLPDAPRPERWLAFLRDLWGDDTESVQVLQQLFGYLLTPDTSQQKIFAIIGPPRSGKGTIARVLKALLGDDAVVNPTLQSLERQFGIAPLVGKSVAIIGDARLGGHSDQQQVVERLLSISGEDALSVDRKNRDPINVRLRVRVLLLSNELPKLYDTSGALASRFVLLTLSKSFLGQEDTGLEAELLAELPGILRWAIEGREDLHERGRFTAPLASETAIAHLRSISNPLGVFLEECCVIEPGAESEVESVYQRYVGWCENNGREPANKQLFARDLHTVHPEIVTQMKRTPDGRRPRFFEGLRL